MSSIEVSKRYAKALVELTKQNGQHKRALEEIKIAQNVITSDTITAEYFSSPLVSPEQKQSVVKQTFADRGFLPEVYNFLILLSEKNRLGVLKEIVSSFQDCIDKEEGVTRGTVIAVRPLSSEAQKELEEKIAKVLNKKIVLSFKEDPRILGGAIAQVGGWTFDDSIDTHLKKLNEELNRSAN